MRIIILSSTFFFLLIASIASAQSPTHTDTSTSAPTSTATSNDELVGTVTAMFTHGGAANTIVTEVTLQNVGTSLIPPITVVVTNVAPIGIASVLSTDWTCDYVGNRQAQSICSILLGSLDAGQSSTLRLELELLTPTPECQFDFSHPNGVIHGDPRTGYYEVCYDEDLSPQVVAFIDNEEQVDLVLVEPFIFHNCQCAWTVPWPTSTPLTMVQPTDPQSIPEPITIVLFGLGVSSMAGFARWRRRSE